MTRALLAAVALALVASGCMSAELARVRRDVGHDVPGLGQGHAPAFGPLTLGLARRMIGDAETAGLLRHVRSVAVGTYALGGPLDADALTLSTATARIEARGWTPVVVSREGTEAAFIYARGDTRGDALRDLLVVAFDADAMTLVRLTGSLDAVVRDALRGQGHGVLGPLRAVGRPDRPAASARPGG